ncbi:MAG: helix-turn-helix transcriptional regulator [Crocosphaera sp.]|jgi:transcriptional regulator with XRE-family HTH domain
MNYQPRKQLGNNIKQLRTKLELSQEQLAEKAGLHRTYIGAVERGERNVSLDNILAIARALGVSASNLLDSVE